MIAELNNRIENLQEQCRNAFKDREFFENEAENMKLSAHDLTKNYEQVLQTKEDQLKRRVEQDHLAKQDLENRLRDSENKNVELLQKCSSLQKELEMQKGDLKDNESELSSLKIELNRVQEKFREANKIIEDYNRLEYDLKNAIEGLKEENMELRSNLANMGIQRKDLEAKFRRITEDITKVN